MALVPAGRIERAILLIRGEKVILDATIARLYGVTVGRLNEAVRRNRDRWPPDFMFQLTKDELESLRAKGPPNLKSQFAISSSGGIIVVGAAPASHRPTGRPAWPRMVTASPKCMALWVMAVAQGASPAIGPARPLRPSLPPVRMRPGPGRARRRRGRRPPARAPERRRHFPRPPPDGAPVSLHGGDVNAGAELGDLLVGHPRADVAPGHLQALRPAVVEDLPPVRDDHVYRHVLGSGHMPEERA